jgi:AraC-like DNA-binding protein
MITARALGSSPRFIESETGPRGLAYAFSVAGLPPGVEHDSRQFITQRSVMTMLDVAARMVGDERLGLTLAPHLSVAEYGTWGRYVLSAPTLHDALMRTNHSLPWHSSQAEFTLSDSGDFVRCAYRVGTAGAPGYENFAYCATGVLVNLARAYLGQTWRPVRVELDLPRSRSIGRAGDAFLCDVQFGADALAILISKEDLGRPCRVGAPVAPITLADVRRAHSIEAPKDFSGAVHEIVRLQLLGSSTSVEETALRLELGVRTLQRRLDRLGLKFRDIVNSARAERAKELLAERELSITHIAAELGYSAPSHFARAFARQTGLSPRQFRKNDAPARH